MNKKFKKVISLIAISIFVLVNIVINYQPGKNQVFFDFNKAFADYEKEKVYCTCYVGKPTCDEFYDEVRWCGSCEIIRVIRTGDGACHCGWA